MKVYTHFYLMDENTAIGFRWRTLLQYGNSWEVIGSVVMKNPGGAKFKSPTHRSQNERSSEKHALRRPYGPLLLFLFRDAER